MKLFAPKEYWEASDELRDEVAGGCGPGGFGDMFVPDTIWGLSVKPACKIHDWMYAFGETDQDKADADEVFLNNMLRIIADVRGSTLLWHLRKRRARTYYLAVKHWGGPAFWDSKNDEAEFRKV